MKIAGYTFGQIVIIVVIAVVGIFVLRQIESKVNVPGLSQLLGG